MTIQMKFASTQKPMLTESQPQILLPLQAQQLGRSYNGRILVNVEINTQACLLSYPPCPMTGDGRYVGCLRFFAFVPKVSLVTDNWSLDKRMLDDIKSSTGEEAVQQFQADIQDLCVGEIPVLVGSCLCHQPVQRATCTGAPVSYFIVTFYHMTD